MPNGYSLVFERECELGPVGQNLAVLDLQVHLRDLRDPQVPKGFAGRLDGTFGGILPGDAADADHIDDPVDSLPPCPSPLKPPKAVILCCRVLGSAVKDFVGYCLWPQDGFARRNRTPRKRRRWAGKLPGC